MGVRSKIALFLFTLTLIFPVTHASGTEPNEKEAKTPVHLKDKPDDSSEGFQYDSICYVDEREDPSLTIETKELVAKIIDNTGLRYRPDDVFSVFNKDGFSHHLGYHAIRTLWRKDERRNIVVPHFSWLNLQGLKVEGLQLDPIDSRSTFGVGRGWPMEMKKQNSDIILHIPQMPVSGIEYTIKISPGSDDAIDFEVTFTLHKKTQEKAAFHASWPCYMATYDEVALYVPTGSENNIHWESLGEPDPSMIIGEAVNHVHSQRSFKPSIPPLYPLAYGRIGSRVVIFMMDRPEVSFFVVNCGGHMPDSPVQNPAWDFKFNLPDYEKDKPFGFRGRIIYKNWTNTNDVLNRYLQWQKTLHKVTGDKPE